MSLEKIEGVSTGSENDDPAVGSLAARVQKRRAELAQRETVIIEVAGYEEFLAVEYRPLPWAQTRRIVQRNQRTRDEGLQQLYVAADTLIKACESVFEVSEEGDRTSLNLGWSAALARRLGWDVPLDGISDRQAMLSYIFEGHDTWLMAHYGEYMMWLQGRREEDDEEVERDFERAQ